MEKLDALVEKLKKYGYDVHTFENAQQAKNYLLETIRRPIPSASAAA